MSLDPAYDVLAEGEVPLAGNFTPRKEVAALRCACSAVCPLDLDHGLLLFVGPFRGKRVSLIIVDMFYSKFKWLPQR